MSKNVSQNLPQNLPKNLWDDAVAVRPRVAASRAGRVPIRDEHPGFTLCRVFVAVA